MTQKERVFRVLSFVYIVPIVFLMASVLLYSRGMTEIGDIVFKVTIVFLGIWGVTGLVRKSYQGVSTENLWQMFLLYTVLLSFFILALLSDVVSKGHYKIIVMEAVVFLLAGVWLVKGFCVRSIRLRRDIQADRVLLVLVLAGLLFVGTIMAQMRYPYRWDSLDYSQQILHRISEFDFTLSNLHAMNRGHISMGFAFVYEFSFLLFGGDPNRILLIHILLGILVEFCIYQILKSLVPTSKSLEIAIGTIFIFFTPLFFGVSGVISTDYIMACFFIYFLFSHIKGYRLLQFASVFFMVMTKETAVVLFAVFLFVYTFLAVVREKETSRKKEILKKEIFNFSPIFLWAAILMTKGHMMWIDFSVLFQKRNLLIAMAALLVFFTVLFCFYFGWSDLVAIRFNYLICALIVVGLVLALFGGKPEMIYKNQDLNRIGFLSMDYILLRLKNLFLLNFQWISWGIIAGFLFYQSRKRKEIAQNPYIFSLLAGVLMFAAVHGVYLTYTHPRYFQPLVLPIGILAVVLLQSCRESQWYKAVPILAALTMIQNFYGIDPVSAAAYQSAETGKGSIIATNYYRKEMPYSDANVYNFEYTYLSEILLRFVRDIDPDVKTLIVIPDVVYPYLAKDRAEYSVWGSLWYTKYGTDVYYDGRRLKSFGDDLDIKLEILPVNSEIKLDFGKYDSVYFLDIPAVSDDAHTSVWFKRTYPMEAYRTYEMGRWKIDAYSVNLR